MFVARVFLFVLVINVEFYLCEKYLHLCIYISVPSVFSFLGHLVRRCDRILSHLAATSGWGNTLCLWVLKPRPNFAWFCPIPLRWVFRAMDNWA